MADEKGRDYKIIAAPDDDPRFAEIQTLDDLPPHMPREVEHFFSVYKQLENKRVQVHGWAGRDRAHAVIRRHMR